MTATTWRGRHGAVLLGPTEHRVATYLADATRHGRITLRTTSLATHLGLERSEAYRITARLRVLGLFGIENDRAGTRGGRRYWRTFTDRGTRLHGERHRIAWARIKGWAMRRAALVAGRLAALRQRQDQLTLGLATVPVAGLHGSTGTGTMAPPGRHLQVRTGGATFAELMAAHGVTRSVVDSWKRRRP